MIKTKKSIYRNTEFIILTGVIVGLLLAGGCSDDDSATGPDESDPENFEVVIEPQNASFEVGEQEEFSAFLISATGDTVNDEFDISWNWFSSDPDVFTVQNGGTASGHNPGEAYCIIEATIENSKVVAKLRFTGRDSAIVFVF